MDLPSACVADGKTFKKPRRPYEKERLDAELKAVGEYGLRNKRELWRVQMALSKIRNAARTLLTLDDKVSLCYPATCGMHVQLLCSVRAHPPPPPVLCFPAACAQSK